MPSVAVLRRFAVSRKMYTAVAVVDVDVVVVVIVAVLA